MRGRSSAGMSLVELLVAVALSAVVLLTGTWLLVLLLHQANDELARAPSVGGAQQLAMEQIERDAQSALSAPDRQDGWEAAADTLLLAQAGSALVIVHREGDRLLRTLLPGPGQPERTRLLAEGVVGADFSLDGALFHLKLRCAAGPMRHRVVLGRNLGRTPPEDT